MAKRDRCPITNQACQTLVSLQEYIETRLEAIEKAASLAHDAVEARLETLNESRGQLRDQASTFATKQDLTHLQERIEIDIRVLREFRSELTGKASSHAVLFAQGIGLVGVILAAIALVIGM